MIISNGIIFYKQVKRLHSLNMLFYLVETDISGKGKGRLLVETGIALEKSYPALFSTTTELHTTYY